jgi:hypothetical protein
MVRTSIAVGAWQFGQGNRRRVVLDGGVSRFMGLSFGVIVTCSCRHPGTHLFGDALNVATRGCGLVHVVGGGEFASQFGFLFGSEVTGRFATE